ncbi:MAG: hypothetical protein KDD44_02410, partial [Bdellovibrionales bacterium]|nr:hypothetical protein [Bdellovibrionales bacterium]
MQQHRLKRLTVLAFGILVGTSPALAEDYSSGMDDNAGRAIPRQERSTAQQAEHGMTSHRSENARAALRNRQAMPADEEVAEDVRETLVDVIEQALDNDPEGVVDYFAENARERIGDTDQEYASLEQSIERLNTAWKRNFNSEVGENLNRARIPIRLAQLQGEDEERVQVSLPGRGDAKQVRFLLRDEAMLGSRWRIEPAANLSPRVVSERLQNA